MYLIKMIRKPFILSLVKLKVKLFFLNFKKGKIETSENDFNIFLLFKGEFKVCLYLLI